MPRHLNRASGTDAALLAEDLAARDPERDASHRLRRRPPGVVLSRSLTSIAEWAGSIRERRLLRKANCQFAGSGVRSGQCGAHTRRDRANAAREGPMNLTNEG